MWMRRNADRVSLLTVAKSTYSSDVRYSLNFQYPNNWRLAIDYVQRGDNGLYVCQVNTHPPRMLTTNVTVLGNYYQFHLCYLSFYLDKRNISALSAPTRKLFLFRFLLPYFLLQETALRLLSRVEHKFSVSQFSSVMVYIHTSDSSNIGWISSIIETGTRSKTGNKFKLVPKFHKTRVFKSLVYTSGFMYVRGVHARTRFTPINPEAL